MSKDKLGGGAEGREEAAHLIQWRTTRWVCHQWRHCVCWEGEEGGSTDPRVKRVGDSR